MAFHIRGLDPEPFAAWFKLPDDALVGLGARRVRADEADAYPCRISLKRAAEGEDLLVVHHEHLVAPSSPYRASGPIFVGPTREQGVYRDELAPILRDRLLSLRAYDAAATIVEAEVAENGAAVALIRRYLADAAVAHVDVHFARRGCFAARVERV